MNLNHFNFSNENYHKIYVCSMCSLIKIKSYAALLIVIIVLVFQITDDSRVALDRYLREHRVNVKQLSWTVY